MALLSLAHLIVLGIWIGSRKLRPSHRTAWFLALWFGAFHLSLGIYLAINGVERPKTEFRSNRNL